MLGSNKKTDWDPAHVRKIALGAIGIGVLGAIFGFPDAPSVHKDRAFQPSDIRRFEEASRRSKSPAVVGRALDQVCSSDDFYRDGNNVCRTRDFSEPSFVYSHVPSDIKTCFNIPGRFAEASEKMKATAMPCTQSDFDFEKSDFYYARAYPNADRHLGPKVYIAIRKNFEDAQIAAAEACEKGSKLGGLLGNCYVFERTPKKRYRLSCLTDELKAALGEGLSYSFSVPYDGPRGFRFTSEFNQTLAYDLWHYSCHNNRGDFTMNYQPSGLKTLKQ